MNRSQRIAAIHAGKSIARWEQARGDYGNRVQAWETEADLIASGYEGPVTVRYAGGGGGGFFAYGVPRSRVGQVVYSWLRAGADPSMIRFSETLDDSRLVLQGEVQRSIGHYDLTYSTVKGIPNREAMKYPEHATGLKALALLKSAFSPSSWEDLQAIFDARPDAVIEFSAFDGDLGDTPGRNVVVWEVREVY